jgi:pyruvate dehydrogenase E2 component (dihydrolipoamide acetyltransferase)
MVQEIRVPRLGWSMDVGVFLGWRKRDGDSVQPGDVLYELEGDKAAQEIEATDAGILRIPPHAPASGAQLPVGTLLGYITEHGEAAPWESEIGSSESRDHSTARGKLDSGRTRSTDSSRHPGHAPAQPLSAAGPRKLASPRARRVARELNVDWRTLQGTGHNGRVRESDVRRMAASGTADAGAQTPPGTVPIERSKWRRVIAQRMLNSSRTTAPVTLTTRVDAARLVSVREQFKAAGGAIVPTYDDVIVKLLGNVLRHHLHLAARWEGDQIVIPSADQINIGLAVDTDDGLLVPVIAGVPQKSLLDVADDSARLVKRARGGRVTLAELSGSVFTVTNLGRYGIDAFTPIINLPESAILGIGAIRREAVVRDDDQIVAGSRLTLSLTFDHRVADGAPAARLLADLVSAIERCDPLEFNAVSNES